MACQVTGGACIRLEAAEKEIERLEAQFKQGKNNSPG